jgi:hypothetical protein
MNILAKKILLNSLFSFFLLLGFSCGSSTTENASNGNIFALYKQFKEKFAPLSLPYEMKTDNKNYAAFTALLTENHHIDSTFRRVFSLDSLTKEASAESIHTSALCCKFYHIGKFFETATFSVILYARNNLPPSDDIYIFLATIDKDGKKIDEILFHKPESTLPPTELNRISSIKADSTIHINNLTNDYQFEAGQEKAKLQRQTLHEKIYKINAIGKIELVKEENKEVPL